jgi:hypothetical protein
LVWEKEEESSRRWKSAKLAAGASFPRRWKTWGWSSTASTAPPRDDEWERRPPPCQWREPHCVADLRDGELYGLVPHKDYRGRYAYPSTIFSIGTAEAPTIRAAHRQPRQVPTDLNGPFCPAWWRTSWFSAGVHFEGNLGVHSVSKIFLRWLACSDAGQCGLGRPDAARNSSSSNRRSSKSSGNGRPAQTSRRGFAQITMNGRLTDRTTAGDLTRLQPQTLPQTQNFFQFSHGQSSAARFD